MPDSLHIKTDANGTTHVKEDSGGTGSRVCRWSEAKLRPAPVHAFYPTVLKTPSHYARACGLSRQRVLGLIHEQMIVPDFVAGHAAGLRFYFTEASINDAKAAEARRKLSHWRTDPKYNL